MQKEKQNPFECFFHTKSEMNMSQATSTFDYNFILKWPLCINYSKSCYRYYFNKKSN